MIRIGMIGCGGISGSHARGWNAVDQDKARVVATADIIEERAKERAEQLGASDYYTDYEKILARDDINGVDICLPHYLHAEATVKAAESGKHVICEKPMAINLQQGKQMLQACEANNRILMMGHQSRYAPINAKFKEMIDEGILGKMFLVRVMQGFYPGLRDFHYQKDKIGGGVLISTGIHVIDLTRWFAGDVKTVAYAGNSLIRGLEGEDTAVMSLEFANGAVGTLVSSWAAKPGATHFWIHGEKGALTTEGGMRFIDGEGNVLQPETEKADPIHKELEHYVDCIITGEKPLTSGEEGYKALQIAVAAYQSEAESRIIDLASL